MCHSYNRSQGKLASGDWHWKMRGTHLLPVKSARTPPSVASESPSRAGAQHKRQMLRDGRRRHSCAPSQLGQRATCLSLAATGLCGGGVPGVRQLGRNS
jgi:hypothetical protein